MMADTVFTRIMQKELPAKLIYEDDKCVAFHDISPQAPVHVLIVPRKQIPMLDDLKPEDAPLIGHLVHVATKLARDLKLDLGYRIVMNCNHQGGQTVFHIHLHLLGGRQMKWPPG
ncbi:MAG: histidine triad nucleotide-binding protein [Bacteroidetes bacterium]|nr:histidine triad nucleotide-binding protein [Bacteroidota bacterium]